MDVDIARVAKREPGMNPVEVMTSESQERMLAIVTPANSTPCSRSARGGRSARRSSARHRHRGFRVFDGLFDAVACRAEPSPPRGDAAPAASSDRLPIADLPVESLGDGPVYNRPAVRPDLDDRQVADPAPVLAARFPSGTDLSRELLALLASPTIADKSWVWRQYDHQLFLNTVAGPGSDAAVLRLKGTAVPRAHDRRCRTVFRARPAVGAQLTVMEAARNVACVGGVSPRAGTA